MPLTEESTQQNELGVAGVLVLVEEDHTEAAALDQSDLGVVLRDLRGQGHLVTEVHHLTGVFGVGVALHERQQLFAAHLCGQQVASGHRGFSRQLLHGRA